MKKMIRLFCVMALSLPALCVFSQKYKTVEDTARLNKEYVKITNDVVELNAKLEIAQNDLPGYQSKAKKAGEDAADAAASSSNQASKVEGGNVNDARAARKRANKAYNEAKDARSANKKVEDQEDKITRYKLDIRKKQQRLEELDVMRTAIQAKMAADTLPQPQQ